MTQSKAVRTADDLSTLFFEPYDVDDTLEPEAPMAWVIRYFEDHPFNVPDQTDMGPQPEDLTPAEVNGLRVLARILRYIIAGGAMAVRTDDLKDVKAAIYDLELAGANPQLVAKLQRLRERVEALLAERRVTLDGVPQAEFDSELGRLGPPLRSI